MKIQTRSTIKWMKQTLAFLLLAAMLLSIATCFGCVQTSNPPKDETGSTESDIKDTEITEQPKDQTGSNESGKTDEKDAEPPKYVIHLADLGENVEIHTQDQAGYLNDKYANITDYIPKIANTERSYPETIELSWTVNENEVLSSAVYQITIGTSIAMSDAKTYTTKNTSYKITNLCIGTTYYWKVSFIEDGVNYKSDIASFTTTSQGPRNLKVLGVTNFRDIGGWKTTDGRTVKQGMVYRTGRVDYITDAGKRTMLKELGIKTEIDLRPGMSKSAALEDVNFLNFGCSDNATLKDLEAALPKIFSVLADEDNYPLFYHCNIGTDRTGGVTFLINAFLGVSEEDLYYDYCFSNFGKISSDDATSFTPRTPETLYGKIVYRINKLPGSTLQEKVQNYLQSIGIPEATLKAVMRLMLE